MASVLAVTLAAQRGTERLLARHLRRDGHRIDGRLAF
jgi:hypothetical protein